MDSPQKKGSKASTQHPIVIRVAEMADLKGTKLFKDVDEEAIRLILGIDPVTSPSRICKLQANRRLYTTRPDGSFLYILLKGYVSIWIPSCFDPTKEIFLAWRGPQQILGELRDVGDEPSITRIKTCDPCEFIEIRVDFFHDLARSHCFLYRNVARLILQKISNERHRSEVVQMKPYSRQVAQTLIHLAQDRCEASAFKQTVLPIPGTIQQEELGAYAGVVRERVNIELNSLRDKKIIAYHGKGSHITILNLQALEEIVQSKPRSSTSGKSARNPKAAIKK